MSVDEMTECRMGRILAAVKRAYEDADLTLPTVAHSSRIVPLRQLVAGQPLERTEHAHLTVADVVSYLSDQFPYPVEIHGGQGDDLSGYLYANRSGGWLLVNQDDPVTRRRFTVAHELGHFLLHALPLLDEGASIFSEAQPGPEATDSTGELGEEGQVTVLSADHDDDADGSTLVPDPAVWEREANQFAAELLMPADLCRALVSELGPRYGEQRDVLAKRLASELLVSQQAMARRLADLGLGVA